VVGRAIGFWNRANICVGADVRFRLGIGVEVCTGFGVVIGTGSIVFFRSLSNTLCTVAVVGSNSTSAST
jgi:hypothetical protein